MASFSVSPGITPTENGSISINIGKKYSFTAGNSVIISGFYNQAARFEAIVSSYDSETGEMGLEQLTNIQGFGSPVAIFTITLAGQRGSKILQGTGPPASFVGRTGDVYIDISTGILYFK